MLKWSTYIASKPSCLTIFWKQSIIPVYLPDCALSCSRILINSKGTTTNASVASLQIRKSCTSRRVLHASSCSTCEYRELLIHLLHSEYASPELASLFIRSEFGCPFLQSIFVAVSCGQSTSSVLPSISEHLSHDIVDRILHHSQQDLQQWIDMCAFISDNLSEAIQHAIVCILAGSFPNLQLTIEV